MAERDPIKYPEREEDEAVRYERAVREGGEDSEMPPPDEPSAVGRHGITDLEQQHPTPARERDLELADEPEEPGPSEDVPDVGRPVDPQGGAHAVDTTRQTVARETGDHDQLVSAEEAALTERQAAEERPREEEVSDPSSEVRP